MPTDFIGLLDSEIKLVPECGSRRTVCCRVRQSRFGAHVRLRPAGHRCSREDPSNRRKNVNEAALSLSDLAKIARDEQVRLARISDVDPREEFEHHVWPFLNELLANVQLTLDGDEVLVPAEL